MEPLVLRLVANSVCVAQRAGKLIREIMSKGDLGIVEKTVSFQKMSFGLLTCGMCMGLLLVIW